MSFITDWIRKVVAPDIEAVEGSLRKTDNNLGKDLNNVHCRLAEVEKAPQAVKGDFIMLKAELRESISMALGEDMDQIQARIGKLQLDLGEAVKNAQGTLKRLTEQSIEVAKASDRRERELGQTIDGRYERRLKAIELAQDYALRKAQEAVEEAQAVLGTAKATLEASNRGLRSCAAFNAKFDILDDKLNDLGKRLVKAEAATIVPRAEKPVVAKK